MSSGDAAHRQWTAVDQWIVGTLARHRIFTDAAQLDPQVVRTSPVSTVTQVTAQDQRYFFKANHPVAAHEIALLAEIGDDVGNELGLREFLPEIIGADEQRGWVLMADGGPTIRELIRASGDTGHSMATHSMQPHSMHMIDRYAALQKASIRHMKTLRACGVPDYRPERLPALLADLLSDDAYLHIDQPGGLTRAEVERLRAFGLELSALCTELARFGLPVALHHDDCHSGNTLLGADGVYRFIDWGECAIAPPLMTLAIMLRDAKYVLKYDQATLDAMRARYLSHWAADLAPEQADRALAISLRLAALLRAQSWRAVVDPNDPEDGDAVAYWLRTFLNDTPLEV